MMRRVLCYGDSNTYGYDPRSYLGGRYPKEVRWTGRLEAVGWQVLNEGMNGRSIPAQTWEIDRAARRIRDVDADAVAVMLGSNDLLQNRELTAEDCGARMEGFLAELLRAVGPEWPGTVLLVAPPPMRPGEWVICREILETSARLSGSYEAAARHLGVEFADAGTWGVELSFDGVHFSEAGHRAFAEGIERKLAALFA